MDRMKGLALLVVDDQTEVLEAFEQVLGEELEHHVECVRSGGEALHHVRNRLFDVAIVDAKFPHKRAPLGGLILAEEVGAILGVDSVILVSQYDVRAEVGSFNRALKFLPKPCGGASVLDWVEGQLMREIRRLVRRQYGFAVMPYGDAESDRWYEESLVPWMREAGFKVRRMDEIPTTRAVNTELQERIRQSHFVVVYAVESNANVYYEAGFAAGLEKYSVMFSTQQARALPFDVRSNVVLPAGSGDPRREREQVLRFMRGLRGVSD